jgi:hypothetical protein
LVEVSHGAAASREPFLVWFSREKVELKRFISVLAVSMCALVVAVCGSATLAPEDRSPDRPCCVKSPSPGDLYLQSYDFPVSGDTGEPHVVVGVAEPKGIILQRIYLDTTVMSAANSQLSTNSG